MNTLITNIMKGIQGDQHIIEKSVVDEIVLALTCNLDDLRTRNYAKSVFPDFFKHQITKFKMTVLEIEKYKWSGQSEYLNPAKNSVIILEAAQNAYNDRMENYEHNE